MRRKAVVGAVALLALGACSGTVDRHDESVQAEYVEAARDAQPELAPIPDEMIVDYGLAICEAFDGGATVRELALATGFAVQDVDVARTLGRLSATATIELCPEHEDVIREDLGR